MSRNPDDYCAICGRSVKKGHKCSDKSLKAIDAAHKRNPFTEPERRKSYGQRLQDGFNMIYPDNDDDD